MVIIFFYLAIMQSIQKWIAIQHANKQIADFLLLLFTICMLTYIKIKVEVSLIYIAFIKLNQLRFRK